MQNEKRYHKEIKTNINSKQHTKEKKWTKLPNQVFSLVNREAEKQKSVVSVHFGEVVCKRNMDSRKN